MEGRREVGGRSVGGSADDARAVVRLARSGNQWQSEAIDGNQRQSMAISGNQARAVILLARRGAVGVRPVGHDLPMCGAVRLRLARLSGGVARGVLEEAVARVEPRVACGEGVRRGEKG